MLTRSTIASTMQFAEFEEQIGASSPYAGGPLAWKDSSSNQLEDAEKRSQGSGRTDSDQGKPWKAVLRRGIGLGRERGFESGPSVAGSPPSFAALTPAPRNGRSQTRGASETSTGRLRSSWPLGRGHFGPRPFESPLGDSVVSPTALVGWSLGGVSTEGLGREVTVRRSAP
jgi:hypothetical protein